MSFDWNEYLQLAKHLGGLRNEAASRTAVSRAYYCAFHAASLSLKSNNITTNPKYARDRHLQVWKIYIDSSDRDCVRIGNKGQRLKIERHAADYEPDRDFPDSHVQRCISQAEELVTGIGRKVPESFLPPISGSGMGRVVAFIKRLF